MPSSASPASVPPGGTAAKRTRPSTITVFASAFVAGAAAAFGINRALDSQLAQSRPQVECDPIFVALHPLPQGSAVTVWDVALRDWPRAMLPSTALGPHDSFEGMVLRHPLREGQPLLSVQLVPSAAAGPAAATSNESFLPPTPAAAGRTTQVSQPDRDLWASDSPEATATPSPTRTASLPRVATSTPSAGSEPIPAAVPSVAAATVPPVVPSTISPVGPSTGPSTPPQAAPAEVPPLASDTPRTAAAEPDVEPNAVTQTQQPEPVTEAKPSTATVVPEPLAAAIPASTPTPVTTPRPIQTESPLAETTVVAEGSPTPADQASQEAITESAAASATERDATAQASNGPQQPERGVVPLPLVAPVPMSPSTDIERLLAAITVPRTPRPEANAVTDPDQSSTPASPPAEPVVQDTIALQEPTLEPGSRPEPTLTEPTAAEPVAGGAATAGIPGNETPATDSVLVAPPTGSEPATTPAPGGSREPAMRYLVVPERIAMQADSSFVSPPQGPSQDQDPTQNQDPTQGPVPGQPVDGTAGRASTQANYAPGGPQGGRVPAVQPLPATAAEARAKQAARPDTRPQKPTNQSRSRTSKPLGGWLPSFMGGGESRGPATTARSGQAPSAR